MQLAQMGGSSPSFTIPDTTPVKGNTGNTLLTNESLMHSVSVMHKKRYNNNYCRSGQYGGTFSYWFVLIILRTCAMFRIFLKIQAKKVEFSFLS